MRVRSHKLRNASSVSDLPRQREKGGEETKGEGGGREATAREEGRRRRKLVEVGGARKFMTVILHGTSSRVPYGPTTHNLGI